MTDFDVTWKWVADVYPYLELKSINWDSIYTVYQPMAATANETEFTDVLSAMLNELQDQHVYLKSKHGQFIQPYYSDRLIKDKDSFSTRVVNNYFNDKLLTTKSAFIKFGILKKNIGYIHIPTFKPARLLSEFSIIQKYMSGTDGLIIDIRNNCGGLCHNVYRFVSWFLESPMQHPECYVLGELQTLHQIPGYGNHHYRNPVVLLVNGGCYSSSDLFTELMKQIPHVTVIGDTTGGGSSGASAKASGDCVLPSGRQIHVSTIDFRGYNGLPWEHVGIEPDIRIEQTVADIRNQIDRQLEYAIQFFHKTNKTNNTRFAAILE